MTSRRFKPGDRVVHSHMRNSPGTLLLREVHGGKECNCYAAWLVLWDGDREDDNFGLAPRVHWHTEDSLVRV
jgi:hypothetical protein